MRGTGFASIVWQRCTRLRQSTVLRRTGIGALRQKAQAALKPLGVDIVPQAYDPASFWGDVAKNKFTMYHGGDGWATIQFFPTRLMPLHHAALVFFVRTRKPGDNLLAGVSNRRLVQVKIG